MPWCLQWCSPLFHCQKMSQQAFAVAGSQPLQQLLYRHLPNHQACVNMLGMGGEQHGWQKISGLGKGQVNLFPYLFVVLVQALLAGFVPYAGRCCSVS